MLKIHVGVLCKPLIARFQHLYYELWTQPRTCLLGVAVFIFEHLHQLCTHGLECHEPNFLTAGEKQPPGYDSVCREVLGDEALVVGCSEHGVAHGRVVGVIVHLRHGLAQWGGVDGDGKGGERWLHSHLGGGCGWLWVWVVVLNSGCASIYLCTERLIRVVTRVANAVDEAKRDRVVNDACHISWYIAQRASSQGTNVYSIVVILVVGFPGELNGLA